MTPTRRGVIGAVLGAAASARMRAAGASTSAPEAATLLAPGPEDGAAAAFARRAAGGLARGLVQAAALRVSAVGGSDGITAANRFATISPAAEGRVLLLLPGAAAQAQLVGDSRARYEPRHWPAVCGSLMPAVLAGRMPASPAAPIRVAIPGLGAAEAAGLLALDLLGRRTAPVVIPAGQAPDAAIAQGQADAVLLCGAEILPRAARMGVQPWFSFDSPGLAREAALPDLPTLGDLLPDPAQPVLMEAVRAAAGALRTRGLLVLPALTSADTVALWRGAARRWAEEERDGVEPGTRRVADGEAASMLATLCPAPEVALAYREWLLRRFNWRAA
ncbi:hypothetical protein [Falsiroseomonas sp. CW058]|uniref:hypothetical protein n=1 Tax=Falsiroseomonas sp. CW058 TaxID=3388664 RepID=UPI003D31DA69